MEIVVDEESDKIFSIPKQIISMKIKRDIIRTRRAVMRRTLLTEANNKKVTDWTLPKMIEKANKAEMLEKEIALE